MNQRKRSLQVWLSLFVIAGCLVYLVHHAIGTVPVVGVAAKTEISECHFLLKNSYVDQPNGRNLILAAARAMKEHLPPEYRGQQAWTDRFEQGSEEQALQELELLVKRVGEAGELDPTLATYLALEGMVKSLKDPYTMAMDPETYARLQQTLHSQPFGGVGLQIGRSGEDIIVFAVLPDTPAAKAGVRAGDTLFSVEQREVADLPVEDVETLLHGDPGTDVFCRFLRDGNFFSRTLRRVELKTRSVQARILEIPEGPKVAWLSVNAFQDDTGKLMGEELGRVLPQQPAGLILDLRDNVGGYVSATLHVASYFLPSGKTVVEIRSRDETQVKATISKDQVKLPMIVVVNRRTASSAEILAGCLQDYGRAELAGEDTFGKGSVQSIYEFASGGALKYTTARYRTPRGRVIDSNGLHPDLEMEELAILNYCKEQWAKRK